MYIIYKLFSSWYSYTSLYINIPWPMTRLPFLVLDAKPKTLRWSGASNYNITDEKPSSTTSTSPPILINLANLQLQYLLFLYLYGALWLWRYDGCHCEQTDNSLLNPEEWTKSRDFIYSLVWSTMRILQQVNEPSSKLMKYGWNPKWLDESDEP